jgi:hypothetical protein
MIKLSKNFFKNKKKLPANKAGSNQGSVVIIFTVIIVFGHEPGREG